MKIGAGGFQAIITDETTRGMEASRVKNPIEQTLMQSEDPNVRKQLYELNKVAERMRQAAEMYNQPLEFKVNLKDKKRPRIDARDRRSGTGREYTLEEAEAWLEEMDGRNGRILNGYV